MEQDQNKVNDVRAGKGRDVCVWLYCTGPDGGRLVLSVKDADASMHFPAQPAAVHVTYWLLENRV